jgi:hypothetical protein
MSECEDAGEDKEDDECHLRTILQVSILSHFENLIKGRKVIKASSSS